MIADIFQLAVTNLRQRGLRSWLTMIGIFIGIAAVIALISLGQGLKAAVNEQFSLIGVDKIIIQPKSASFGPPGSFSPSEITTKDLDTLQRIQGVRSAAGRILSSVRLEFNDHVSINFGLSWPADFEEASLLQEINRYSTQEGRMLEPEDKRKVVIGSGFNRKKVFDKEVHVGNKIFINGEKFEVTGILVPFGDTERDDAVVMSEDDLREMTHRTDQYNLLVAKIDSGENIDGVSERVVQIFRRQRHLEKGKEDFDVQTPQQLLQSFGTILNIVQAVLVGIAAISLLVGGIGITNTMYTTVLERTKEIGILKAIGAQRKDILLLFLLESGLLGLLGGGIGTLIGAGLSKGVEIIASYLFGSPLIKAEISATLIIFALTFSFLIGTLSGLMPAKRAMELQPIEALRYE